MTMLVPCAHYLPTSSVPLSLVLSTETLASTQGAKMADHWHSKSGRAMSAFQPYLRRNSLEV